MGQYRKPKVLVIILRTVMIFILIYWLIFAISANSNKKICFIKAGNDETHIYTYKEDTLFYVLCMDYQEKLNIMNVSLQLKPFNKSIYRSWNIGGEGNTNEILQNIALPIRRHTLIRFNL